MEWLGSLTSLLPAGGWGMTILLGGVLLWLVLTDRLVSRRRLRDVMVDRDMWRKTAESKDAALDELTYQNGLLTGELTQLARTRRGDR